MKGQVPLKNLFEFSVVMFSGETRQKAATEKSRKNFQHKSKKSKKATMNYRFIRDREYWKRQKKQRKKRKEKRRSMAFVKLWDVCRNTSDSIHRAG